MEKVFGNLSEFEKRDVELFRSSDLKNTAIYFTDVRHEDRNVASAFFEILRFGLEGGDHQVYVRFPNNDYFTEMIGGGFGSGRGSMIQAHGKNVWQDNNKAPLTVYSHDNNLVLLFGRKDWTPEFNFMTKVASYDKGNKFCHPYPNETFVNFSEIEKALSMKYLKIPEDVRKVEYCYKTKDVIPKYYLIDYPAYNFKYENHRFFVIENDMVKQFEIKNFLRFRDGGTTIVNLLDENGVEHKFFSPQTMFPTEKELSTTFDDVEIIEATEFEKASLVSLLGLELEPVEEEDNLGGEKYNIEGEEHY